MGMRRVYMVGLIIAALCVAWHAATRSLLPELVFPSPESVWAAARRLGFAGLATHASHTFARVIVGWCVGALLGTLVGLAMTWNRQVFEVAYPILEFLRPLPPIALIPFFILWFGLGAFGQILLIGLGCFMVMAVTTAQAARDFPPRFVQAAATLGAGKWSVYRTVIMPGIIPALVPALRVAAALAFGVAVAAELMGAQTGVGFLMMVARRTLNTDTILLGIIIISLQSYGLDAAIRYGGYLSTQWLDRSIDTIERLS